MATSDEGGDPLRAGAPGVTDAVTPPSPGEPEAPWATIGTAPGATDASGPPPATASSGPPPAVGQGAYGTGTAPGGGLPGAYGTGTAARGGASGTGAPGISVRVRVPSVPPVPVVPPMPAVPPASVVAPAPSSALTRPPEAVAGDDAAGGATGAPEPVAGAGHRTEEPVPVSAQVPVRPRARAPRPLTIAADHSYAARLTPAGGPEGGAGWCPERWTLDGPEPYAVPLPLDRPEAAEAEVLPLSDGRVLIRRRAAADRHTFSLLYPTGPDTGELPLGAVIGTELTLLPPAPDGMNVYALLPGTRSTGVWLVAGGAYGPEHIADVPGRCSGGAWLDREGRLLALDRQMPGGGPVKTIVVDLGRGGEVTPLLQIAPESNDRVLLADADSGLLVVSSDAPGQDRLGWGVLGSCLPVRFPECLRVPEVTMTPFAVQPGQMLMPESCAVALRIDGREGSWVGLWRPAGRRLHQFAAPAGWLTGSGFWTRDGMLHLPYAREDAPCAVALLEAPTDEPHQAVANGTTSSAEVPATAACTPVPLGQAPLTGRTAPG
ncbi:hypothetical protein AB0M42_31550 [Streptomyces sp. NPDC051784]|uniref:hypothetical protein n=1 Tax=Streptomyces sp. NPDC051784 TaxID=3155805 RepID=UPI003447BE4A